MEPALMPIQDTITVTITILITTMTIGMVKVGIMDPITMTSPPIGDGEVPILTDGTIITVGIGAAAGAVGMGDIIATDHLW